jgi:hypothetical protein
VPSRRAGVLSDERRAECMASGTPRFGRAVVIDRHTPAPVGARNSAHVTRPADTRGAVHVAGRAVGLCSCRSTSAGGVIVGERYASRWGIEHAFADALQIRGVGDGRNRTRRAVGRTVPFGLICFSVVTIWYALHGHAPDDVASHRTRARWYTTKTEPSYDDMAVSSAVSSSPSDFAAHALSRPLREKPGPSSPPGRPPAYDQQNLRNTRVLSTLDHGRAAAFKALPGIRTAGNGQCPRRGRHQGCLRVCRRRCSTTRTGSRRCESGTT